MDARVATSTRFMLDINSAVILAQLRSSTSTSVSALARGTALSRQAVTRSLNALRDAGFVEFLGPDRSSTSPGRPAQTVRFKAEAGYVLGVSVDPEEIRVALSNLGGATVASAVRLLPHPVMDTLLDTVQEVLDSAGVSPDSVWHTSIGAPGVVDPVAGTVQYIPSMPDISGDVLVKAVRDHLSCPVYLDNNLKLATEGERWRGHDRRSDSMVLIYWGDRVGAGIVIDGRLYRGASNDAGDIGFLDLAVDETDGVATDDREAKRRGRFERWVGSLELVRLAVEAGEQRGDHPLVRKLTTADRALEVLIEAVHEENAAALDAVDEIARRFSLGIAAVRAILDPELVVIGGPLAQCGETLLSRIREHLDGQPLTQPGIDLSRLGDDAMVQGAIHHSLGVIARERLKLPPGKEDVLATQ